MVVNECFLQWGDSSWYALCGNNFRWGWEAATLELRNVHYKTAIANFRTRLGGVFGVGSRNGLSRLKEKVLGSASTPTTSSPSLQSSIA